MKLKSFERMLALMAVCLPMGASAQEEIPATLEVIPFSISAGEEKEIDVELNNPSYQVCGIQFDMYLPEGIDVVLDEYSDPDLYGGRSTKITTEGSIQGDGSLRVLAYSAKNYVYTGTEGAVVTINVKASNTLAKGVYVMELKNMFVTKYVSGETSKVIPADYKASIFSGSPQLGKVTVEGHLSADGCTALNGALKDNGTITSLDLSNVTGIDSESEINSANPNMLIFVPEKKVPANKKNVVEKGVCACLSVSDGKPFETPSAFTATSATYTRAAGNAWGTICLPFAVASDSKVQYYTLETGGVDLANGKLTFTEASTVPAGTPAVFCRTEGEILSVSASNVEVKAGAAGLYSGGLQMLGTYEPTTITGDNYFIAEDAFWKAETDEISIPAFRAYFKGMSSEVKNFSISLDNETGLKTVSVEMDKDAIYDLMGRNLLKVQKGINIVNGKKILVK